MNRLFALTVCLAACSMPTSSTRRSAVPRGSDGDAVAEAACGAPVRLSYFRFLRVDASQPGVTYTGAGRGSFAQEQYIVLQSAAYTRARGCGNGDAFAAQFVPQMGQGVPNDVLEDLANDMVRGGLSQMPGFDPSAIPPEELRGRSFAGTVLALEAPGIVKTVLLRDEDREARRVPREFFDWESRINDLATTYAVKIVQSADPLPLTQMGRGGRMRVSYFQFVPVTITDEQGRTVQQGTGVKYFVLQTAASTFAGGAASADVFSRHHAPWFAAEVPDAEMRALIQRMVSGGLSSLPDFDERLAADDAVAAGRFPGTVIEVEGAGISKRAYVTTESRASGRAPAGLNDWEAEIFRLADRYGAPPVGGPAPSTAPRR